MISALTREILTQLHIREYKRNEVLFEEGDLADETMFFLFKGELVIYKDRNGQREKIKNIYPGEFFGEIGPINNQPRMATIISLTDGAKVGLFDKHGFFLIAQSSPDFLFNMFRDAIKKLSDANQKFMKLAEDVELAESDERAIDDKYCIKRYNIREYVNDVTTKTYMKNDVVFLEGDVSDGAMYFIFEGEFSVSRRNQEGIDRVLTYLKQGDFFGEMALLLSESRSATIKAASLSSRVAKIDKIVFKRVSRVNPAFLFVILKVMFARLTATEEKITKLHSYLSAE